MPEDHLKDTLKDYGTRRDFDRTPEPRPAPPRGRAVRRPLTFVVHKHAASRLHYDFRLEVEGVLKSWALPKGPSLDPRVRRLAVMVEDHPLDYASFEGVIPEGGYGAGRVIVWDRGSYSPDEDGTLVFDDSGVAGARVRRGLAEGKLSFTLCGHKLKGSWALVKLRRGPDSWLLIKHRDSLADPSRDILKEDRSVVSGRTLEEVQTGGRPARDLAGPRFV